MEIFKDLIGNEDIKNSLGVAIQEKRFSHAYIIEGAYGTGKKTVARLAAASILCQGKGEGLPCGKADVRVLEITKVDDARELRSTLYESSSEYDYKIYIIENAEKMNIKAQNALLISLEEPPKNVVFFLLTQDASALLETIRSRAQILRTKPLSRETIFSYIKENASLQISDERLMEIVVSSAGSLGYALDMLDTKKSDEVLALRDLSLELVSSVLKNNADSVTFMFSLFGKTRDELKEILSLSTTVIGDVILLKKDTNVPLYFFSSADRGIALGEGHSVQRLLAIYDALLDAKDALNSNANVATTLMSILSSSKKKGN